MSNRQEIDFDYYDDVNEDIIGKPPKKILLWANIIIGIIFLTLLLVSIFLKLPSKVNSAVEIKYSKAPVNIQVDQPWKHITFLIKHNSFIKKGDVIAQINDSVSYHRIMQLKEWLNSRLEDSAINMRIPDGLFVADYSLGYFFQRFQTIRLLLNPTAPISPDGEKKIRNAIKELLTKILDWEMQNLIKSPETGLIELNAVPREGIDSQKNVGIVFPPEGHFVAYSMASVKVSPQIKKGLKVQIKLINYPYESYGVLEGSVDSIFNIANSDSCLIKIDLPGRLVTTKGIKIDKVYELKGNSEIIIFERSILQTLVGKNYRL